ncbi:DsbA family protein [Malaciobacter mytili LMG 24559]|uniref:DsbA family protein n=1 Tax=Malaciobacter mytili LMG 24559 TaxID=1032238 RepID=A0AAX2AKG4_9BACT|nr:DsbA family protein [Malaciobacter mytili]AXH14601.1 DsbA family protein, FrnE-like subfamily [Malaciobacter mytili LMG 24559]RXK16653.1 DsbA family protein [Malaciobacter mytili LMG 24559]
MKYTLYYIHDPMCSWCYAFKPTLNEIKNSLDKDYKFINIVGGLAKHTQEPMPKDMQEMIENIWYQIENEVGTKFNHNFWRVCTPRRSTYEACKAVIIARQYNKEEQMIEAIQEAYYQKALNPSNWETLISLAQELNIPKEEFEEKIKSNKAQTLLEEDLNLRRKLKVRVFPTLLLKYKKEIYPINIQYNEPLKMLKQIKDLTSNIYF